MINDDNWICINLQIPVIKMLSVKYSISEYNAWCIHCKDCGFCMIRVIMKSSENSESWVL